jgi:hypothetical protein
LAGASFVQFFCCAPFAKHPFASRVQRNTLFPSQKSTPSAVQPAGAAGQLTQLACVPDTLQYSPLLQFVGDSSRPLELQRTKRPFESHREVLGTQELHCNVLELQPPVDAGQS